MSRKEAREKLLNLVFQFCFLKEVESFEFNSLKNDTSLDEENKSFITTNYLGVCENFKALEEAIKANLRDFSMSQVFKVDYAILLIAIYELKHSKTPKAIIINEALELAKKFSTDKSSSFINGILSSVLKGENNDK